ncbi:MAG: arylsulfatase [Kiritimatiellae bacterium]|nr:arylsulfatase [Kiritimatiellia bacterium]
MPFTRRRFLKTLGVGTAVLGLRRHAVADAARRKPNIIYILADDLGYGDLSCFGQKKFTTPHLDRMAAEGMKFTQHYSGNTVCAPSRCCLMTGKHPGHAFIRANKGVKPEGQYPIPADSVTVPKLLRQAGYRAGMFGKWGLGGPGSTGDPMNQGFDEFFGYNCQSKAHSYYPRYLWHNAEKVPLDGKTYSHDLIVARAFEFIRANKDRPFFCYMPVTIPHAAMQVPEEVVAPFRKTFLQFEDRKGRYGKAEVTNPIACFAAMVSHLDSQVGRLFTLLKELGLEENTLVIFTSDNGPHREGGHDPVFFDSNGPLRGIKRDLYEGGIRVPMLARWPGRVPAGVVSDHLSAFWDMMPTFTELAGVKAPGDIDGLSMVAALEGDGARQKRHAYLYWEYPPGNGKQAIRMGKWKGVRLGVSKRRDAPIQLFDLEQDLGEQTDVAEKHPEVVARMKALFAEARVESEVFPLFQ